MRARGGKEGKQVIKSLFLHPQYDSCSPRPVTGQALFTPENDSIKENTMDVPVSKSLKGTFLVHMIVALVLGVSLLLIPGRALTLLGWVPEQIQVQAAGTVLTAPGTTLVDPVITRLLGVALLALGYSSFLGWRASRREQVILLVQTELVYCVLGVVAILAGLHSLQGWSSLLTELFSLQPAVVIGFVMALILAAFAVAWGLALRR
jgi:hypothetical protein